MSSSPTVDAGDPLLDLMLPSAYQNLLANPSFESGTASWSVNVGGTTQGSCADSLMHGNNYFYSGAVGAGIRRADDQSRYRGVHRVALDASNLSLVFGGRVRSAAEAPADQGKLILTFLNGSGAAIGIGAQRAGHQRLGSMGTCRRQRSRPGRRTLGEIPLRNRAANRDRPTTVISTARFFTCCRIRPRPTRARMETPKLPTSIRRPPTFSSSRRSSTMIGNPTARTTSRGRPSTATHRPSASMSTRTAPAAASS